MTIYYKADDEIKNLYNFDENYLNHSFIVYDNSKFKYLNITCEKCNITGYSYSKNNKCYFFEYKTPYNKIINLTCNEQIIKKILE